MPMVAGSSPVFFDMYKNFKSLLKNLLDNHINDYLTTVFRRSNWGVIFVILSSVAILLVSSFFCILWLFLPTVYFLFNKEYKNIFSIWGGLLLSWYLMFTMCMFGFDGPIIVNPDFFDTISKEYCEPIEVLHPFEYVLVTFVVKEGWLTYLLGHLCMETLVLMGVLSITLGYPIYIPSIFKGLIILFNFILGRKG